MKQNIYHEKSRLVKGCTNVKKEKNYQIMIFILRKYAQSLDQISA